MSVVSNQQDQMIVDQSAEPPVWGRQQAPERPVWGATETGRGSWKKSVGALAIAAVVVGGGVVAVNAANTTGTDGPGAGGRGFGGGQGGPGGQGGFGGQGGPGMQGG
ncbi:MAG: hypothetical protein L0H26_12250, partial [Microlunatus sp.]|nr:hypothetical protein [Microlunatus sp.]